MGKSIVKIRQFEVDDAELSSQTKVSIRSVFHVNQTLIYVCS